MAERPHKQVTIVIVGCGNRGHIYANYALLEPSLCKVVGIAEPREYQRKMFTEKFSVPAENVFADWKDLVAAGKLADAVVCATQDKMHRECAVALVNLGYHILLEKPMATTPEDCKLITEAVDRNKVLFAVGHVMRYTPYSKKLKSLLNEKIVGDIVNIQHTEPVGWYHFAHSYVRGNWRREDESCFSLMTKSCHDIDWLLWIMDKKCTKVSSFGSLKHFKASEKPTGAGTRCLDCSVEESCPYSAKKLYITGPRGILTGNKGWPNHIITDDPTPQSVTTALQTGPYGRCVYECDNDVVDNQIVNMQFEDGSTASFTMIANTEDVCIRRSTIFGTLGEIQTRGENEITVFIFATGKSTTYTPDPTPDRGAMNGHGGGDYELMKGFVEGVATNNQQKVTNVHKSLASHLAVFSAEESRKKSCVVDLSW